MNMQRLKPRYERFRDFRGACCKPLNMFGLIPLWRGLQKDRSDAHVFRCRPLNDKCTIPEPYNQP